MVKQLICLTSFPAFEYLLKYFLVAFVLALAIACITFLPSKTSNAQYESGSEYECGFSPFDAATRLPFDIHFYLVGILFLIFDVEIVLVFPWVLSLAMQGWDAAWEIVGFINVLAVGFCYEWSLGAMTWPAYAAKLKQHE